MYNENDYLSNVNEKFKTGTSDINEQTLKLLYTIHNLDENSPDLEPADIKKLKQEKMALLINYISHKIFSGYPSIMAKELLSEVFIQKSIIPSTFNELSSMVETINLIDLCYKRDDARIELNNKFGYILDLPAFDTFIRNIWGRHYDHLLNLHVANSLKSLSNIIWDIPNTKFDTKMRYRTITFDPGTLNIELLLGNPRYGADHLFRGHKKDFVKLSKNLNTAEKINQFIRERII